MTQVNRSDLITIVQMSGWLKETPETLLDWVEEGKFPRLVCDRNGTIGWTATLYWPWVAGFSNPERCPFRSMADCSGQQ